MNSRVPSNIHVKIFLFTGSEPFFSIANDSDLGRGSLGTFFRAADKHCIILDTYKKENKFLFLKSILKHKILKHNLNTYIKYIQHGSHFKTLTCAEKTLITKIKYKYI